MPQNLPALSSIKREEFCSLFVDSLPFAAALLDRDMNYLVASPQWVSELQLEHKEILGRSHYDVFPQHYELLKAAQQHCLTKTTDYCVEEALPQVDDSTRWRQWKMRAWQDSVGEIGGVMLTLEDITHRKPVAKVEASIHESDRQALEAQLEIQKARFDAFFERANAGLVVLDDQLRYIHINEALAEMNGVSAKAHLGRTIAEVLPHLALTLVPMFQEILATGQPVLDYELIGETPKQPGKTRYWLASYYPLTSAKGDKLGIGGVVIEISDRKRVEQALRESEAMYRQMLDAIPDMVLCKGEQSRIIYGNRAFRNFYGMSEAELRGLIDSPINDPDYTQQYVQDDFQVFSTGQTLNIAQEPVTRHDGIVRLFHTIKTPIFNADGAVVQTIGVSRDITERKQAELELERGKHQLEEAQRIAHIGSWDFDVATQVIRWSDEVYRIHGLPITPSAPTYAELLALQHPEDHAIFQAAVGKAISEAEPYSIEYRIIRPDGSIHYVSAKGEAVLDEQGQVIQLVGSVLDITDRKQTEAALRQSEAQLREKAKREQLLNQLTNQIRSSLNLEQILETAVQTIQQLLNLDSCLFVWYRQNGLTPHWEITQEAKKPGIPSLLGFCASDAEILPLAQKTLKREITRINDLETESDAATQQFFTGLGYRAALSIPVHTQAGEIGVLSCSTRAEARDWRDQDVALLQAVADNLAIAIDQAKLYEQSRAAATTAQAQAQQLQQALQDLQQTQAQLVQTEKMSSLGQLVAGIAHEINNPVNFIYGNLTHADEYMQDLLNLLALYQTHYPQPHPEIQDEADAIDLEFLVQDLPKLLSSMKVGADRIQKIVLALRNFSRMDEAEIKEVNIHEGIDSTLMILHNRLKDKPEHRGIEVIKNYGNLPLVQCYAGQLNQVFMNILSNAIDALDERDNARSPQEIKANPSQITIHTQILNHQQVQIRIADNGLGMSETVRRRLFEPFFTTKAVGKGTGLGLSISYQVVVEKHKGDLICVSAPGEGSEFLITLPLMTH